VEDIPQAMPQMAPPMMYSYPGMMMVPPPGIGKYTPNQSEHKEYYG